MGPLPPLFLTDDFQLNSLLCTEDLSSEDMPQSECSAESFNMEETVLPSAAEARKMDLDTFENRVALHVAANGKLSGAAKRFVTEWRRKIKNRDSAKTARGRQKVHLALLEGRIMELEAEMELMRRLISEGEKYLPGPVIQTIRSNVHRPFVDPKVFASVNV